MLTYVTNGKILTYPQGHAYNITTMDWNSSNYCNKIIIFSLTEYNMKFQNDAFWDTV